MHEHADRGDHDQEARGQRVHVEAEVDRQVAGGDPRPELDVEALLAENQSLKADLNRFSEYTPKELSGLNGSLAISAVREVQL